VVVLGLAIVAFIQRQEAIIAKTEAEKIARISKSYALAALALMEINNNPELSLLLSIESLKKNLPGG